MAEVLQYSRSGQNFGQSVLREINLSLTSAFASVETVLDLQASEVPMEDNSSWALVCLWLQFICLAAYTI